MSAHARAGGREPRHDTYADVPMGSSAVLMPMHFWSMSIARPKSATRKSLFASSRMLCVLRSLCTRFLEWQKAMASAIWMPRSKKVEYLGWSAGRASERASECACRRRRRSVVRRQSTGRKHTRVSGVVRG